MQKYTQFWLTIILIGFGFIVADRGLSFMFSKALLESNARFSKVYKGDNDFELIILGSSRGNKSFVPSLFRRNGIKTLQLSYQGVSSQIAVALFKDYLVKSRPPKSVIFDVTSIQHQNNSLIGLKPYCYYSPNLYELMCRESRSFRWGALISKLYILNGESFFRAMYYMNKSDQDVIESVTYTTSKAKSISQIKSLSSIGLSLIPENLDAIKELVGICDSKGIKLYLFYPPMNPFYLERTDEIIKEQIHTVSNYVSHSIYDCSNFSSNIDHFIDLTHVNFWGAQALTEHFIHSFFQPD